MELTHEDIQKLHKKVREWKKLEQGDSDSVYRDGPEYEIVNSIDSTTEAIAVAPIVDGKIDYSKTIVLTAGTQTTFTSGTNAGIQAFVSGLSPQYDEMDEFFSETQKRLEEKGVDGGQIYYSSAHSQAGVPNAKLSVKYRVKEIVNFYDWGAKKAVDSGVFSSSEMKYLKKHAIIYSDFGKGITRFDGNGGAIPYGQVRVYEGKSHNIQTPFLKGNNYDFDKYIRENKFVSGMTEKQVRKIAEYKAKNFKPNLALSNYGLEDNFDRPEHYIKEYLDNYGPFAPEPTKQDLISLNIKQIKELKDSLKTSSGSKKISLREELVRVSAETAKLQAEVYEEEIKSKIESEKEKVSQKISSLKSEAYSIARHLPSSEVEVLLSELTLDTAWNSGKETKTITAASDYKNTMSQISDNLNKVADRIIESDQIGAKIFSN